MYSAAKARAKRLGLSFELNVADIVIPTHCPVLGIPLFFTNDTQTANTPALDRKDNSKGYTKENAFVISHKANRHKADLSVADIQRLAAYVTS